MKKIIIAIIVVILIILAAWFFVGKKQETKTAEEIKTETQAASFGGVVSDAVGEEQPLEKIPNVNVFNSVETNPYKSGYTNPFAK
ncbi:MAG: hypothetical protein WAV23_01965 [Minisyncoccia bacterium]